MIVTIFRSRLRSEHSEEYALWAREMDELAAQMPGFLSIKTFRANDGERCSVVEFADWESHQAWAQHPRHREAQKLGREKFYAEFSIRVGEVTRSYGFKQDSEEDAKSFSS
jgi:heme-degrading monooxygenase HmoA